MRGIVRSAWWWHNRNVVWCAACAISLLRVSKGRMLACRFSQAPHVAKAIAAALLPQLEEVRMSFHPPSIGRTVVDESNQRWASQT